jgi:hypothetical protein
MTPASSNWMLIELGRRSASQLLLHPSSESRRTASQFAGEGLSVRPS